MPEFNTTGYLALGSSFNQSLQIIGKMSAWTWSITEVGQTKKGQMEMLVEFYMHQCFVQNTYSAIRSPAKSTIAAFLFVQRFSESSIIKRQMEG